MGDLSFPKNINDLLPQQLDRFRLIRLVNDIYLMMANTTVTGYVPTTLTDSHILVGNSSNIATDVAMSGDATIGNTGILTLANSGASAGTYGDSSNVAQVTVDAKGRITTVSNVAIGVGSAITALTGDGTATGPGSVALTFATVNSSPGTFGDATKSLTATVNGKGLITALSENTLPIADWTFISSKTATSGDSNLEFTSIDNSTYKSIKLVIEQISPTTDSDNLEIQFYLGGTLKTDSSYAYAVSGYREGGVSLNGQNSGTTNILLAANIFKSSATNSYGEVTLPSINSSSARKFIMGQFSFLTSSGGAGHISTLTSSGQYFGATTALDGVRLLFSSGTISSLVVHLFGRKY